MSSHKNIEVAAYYNWIQRGCPLGDDWNDWFCAQRNNSVLLTPEIITKMKEATSSVQLMEVCKAEGIGLDEKAAEKWFLKLNSGELAAKELASGLLGGCSSTVHCPKCGSSNYTQRYVPISIFDGTLYCHCNACGYDAVIG